MAFAVDVVVGGGAGDDAGDEGGSGADGAAAMVVVAGGAGVAGVAGGVFAPQPATSKREARSGGVFIVDDSIHSSKPVRASPSEALGRDRAAGELAQERGHAAARPQAAPQTRDQMIARPRHDHGTPPE